MSMEKTILVIDDAPDNRELDELKKDLEHEVNNDSSISYTVNLSWEKPADYIDFSVKINQLDPLFQHLESKYLNKKLDMFLCDFNLHSEHKHLAFLIIDFIRTKNKTCTIILYSGSPLKELIRINNGDLATKISEHIIQENTTANIDLLSEKLEKLRKEEEPAEELMEMAVKSNISKIVSRTKYEETAIDLITKPSLLLWIENELTNNSKRIFNDGHEKLNGLKFEEIAKLVREQTEEGIYFTNEIIRISIANLINLNS
jgi:hypothetical protein